jgi:peptide/nickel transport system substrate-binding protein
VRNLTRSQLSVAALLGASALVVSACTASTSSGGTGGSATSSASSSSGGALPEENINNTGTPIKGGTLHMLGLSDVDYLDPNITYYSTGYEAARLYSRQLVTFPAVAGKATTDVPDLATEMPTVDNGGISKDGLTYTFTIKTGVKWNTPQARQVTAADFIRGMKRVCNPAQSFGGLPDFESLIKGLQEYCDAYLKTGADGKTTLIDPKNAAAMAKFQNTHDITGLKADASNPLKFTITLTHPATYFVAMLSLPAFSPAPVEYDKYVPASAELAQHTISDGPYQVTSYSPTKSITFDRNPAWDAATDDVRKAYVDQIVVNETGKQEVILQQLQANTADADLMWDTFPPVTAVPGLMDSKDPNFYLGQTFSSNPYIIFNTVSPNNGGALSKVEVRRAISEAINRDNIIQADNGPAVSPPLTHVLPVGISGTTSNTSFDLYPHDATKAKADLAAAGFPNGLTLKFLYRPASSLSSKLFTLLQQDLGDVGIKLVGVEASQADFYTKYLQVPDQARKGVWDVSLAGWGPDWYGDAALSFFAPLFYGDKAYPPGGSNFGLYNNPTVNDAITKAANEADPQKAQQMWADLDKQVMQDAPFYPITSNNEPTYHASHVHNTVYIPAYQAIDPANVWLSKP